MTTKKKSSAGHTGKSAPSERRIGKEHADSLEFACRGLGRVFQREPEEVQERLRPTLNALLECIRDLEVVSEWPNRTTPVSLPVAASGLEIEVGRKDAGYRPQGAVLALFQGDPGYRDNVPGSPGDLVYVGAATRTPPRTQADEDAREHVIRELSARDREDAFWPERELAAVRAAFAALEGYEPGQRWRRELALEVTAEAQIRAADRYRASVNTTRQGGNAKRRAALGLADTPTLRQLPSNEGDWGVPLVDSPAALAGLRPRQVPSTPAEILANVSRRASPPSWMTAAVVEDLVDATGKPGGPHGVVRARDLIDALARAHEKKD